MSGSNKYGGGLVGNDVGVGLNPLSQTEVSRYASILRRLLVSLGREVVETALVGDGQPDLLGPVGEVVDRLGELTDRRASVGLEFTGFACRGLAVLDAFERDLEAAVHDVSSRVGASPGRDALDTTLEEAPDASSSRGMSGATPGGAA